MARFNIGGYTRYNAGRVAAGRAPIRPSTFTALEEVGVSATKIEEWMARSAAVAAAKLVKAAEVADYWKSIAPVFGETGRDPKRDYPPYGEPIGAYRDSIKVMRKGREIAVGATSYNAHWVEYGTEKMAEFATGAEVLAHFSGGEAKLVDGKIFIG